MLYKGYYICKNERPVCRAACKYNHRHPRFIELTADVFIIILKNNKLQTQWHCFWCSCTYSYTTSFEVCRAIKCDSCGTSSRLGQSALLLFLNYTWYLGRPLAVFGAW